MTSFHAKNGYTHIPKLDVLGTQCVNVNRKGRTKISHPVVCLSTVYNPSGRNERQARHPTPNAFQFYRWVYEFHEEHLVSNLELRKNNRCYHPSSQIKASQTPADDSADGSAILQHQKQQRGFQFLFKPRQEKQMLKFDLQLKKTQHKPSLPIKLDIKRPTQKTRRFKFINTVDRTP